MLVVEVEVDDVDVPTMVLSDVRAALSIDDVEHVREVC